MPSNSPIPRAARGVNRVFTTREAAEACGVSLQTIIRCFDSGRLGGFRVPGSRTRRIPLHDLVRFMRANGIPTTGLEGPECRVLTIDDDQRTHETLMKTLAQDDRFSLRTVGTAFQAGLLTAQFKPHLIVLNPALPGVDDQRICQQLRADAREVDRRIIVLFRQNARGELKTPKAGGADAYVRKPVIGDDLVKQVLSVVQVGRET